MSESAAQGRAEGVLEALDREQERAAEPWLSPASLRVLAADNLALLAEIERLREQVNDGRLGRERAEGLPEGTLPRV